MKLMFLGADHEVTGSCHYIEACGKSILLDCGMEQGRDTYENQEIPVAAGRIDYVFLSPAHIDHSGLLPLLHKNGFQGQIYATEATTDLCRIMLLDSAHIQEFEAEWKNRKGQRSGAEPVEPMYTVQDAEAAMKLFVGKAYEQRFQLAPGIEARFVDVGHLLGSASIELWITEGETTTKLVFSGDIGNINQPIIHDPRYTTEADYVIMESTYGDRYHTAPPDYVAELAGQIQQTFDRGGNLVIPSFAVERTQEILYCLHILQSKGKLPADMPVFVDSPLAIRATEVFRRNRELFDEDAQKMLHQGDDPFELPNLRYTLSAAESQSINDYKGPAIIISASGMCNAGRVRHHLKHNIWKPGASIVFVGYQAVGTPAARSWKKPARSPCSVKIWTSPPASTPSTASPPTPGRTSCSPGWSPWSTTRPTWSWSTVKKRPRLPFPA